MFPISEPISNHLLLSLLILLPLLAVVAYAPWNRLEDVTVSVNQKSVVLSGKQLRQTLRFSLAFLAMFSGLSVFRLGLSAALDWLAYPYLAFALLLSLAALNRSAKSI